jgi:hypothetical protein
LPEAGRGREGESLLLPAAPIGSRSIEVIRGRNPPAGRSAEVAADAVGPFEVACLFGEADGCEKPLDSILHSPWLDAV